jgi:hypothetical protein
MTKYFELLNALASKVKNKNENENISCVTGRYYMSLHGLSGCASGIDQIPEYRKLLNHIRNTWAKTKTKGEEVPQKLQQFLFNPDEGDGGIIIDVHNDQSISLSKQKYPYDDIVNELRMKFQSTPSSVTDASQFIEHCDLSSVMNDVRYKYKLSDKIFKYIIDENPPTQKIPFTRNVYQAFNNLKRDWLKHCNEYCISIGQDLKFDPMSGKCNT